MPSTLKIKYLLMHAYEILEVEGNSKLCERWLKVLSKYINGVVEKIRQALAETVKSMEGTSSMLTTGLIRRWVPSR